MENNNCNDLYTDAVGYWDFTKSLNDISGKIGTMNIRKNAQLITGKGLKVTDGSYCSTNLGSPSVSIGKSKTLISWVTLDNLDSKAGSPFGLQIDGGGDYSKHQFDSLVWAEKENGKWMHGSEYFNRTRKDTSPVPVMNSSSTSLNWKKPSISCDTDRIYINAKADSSSVTNKNEYECQETCGKQDKCDMYLMSSDNTCHLYNNVSNVTEYCSPDSPGPPHRYWGKVKSNNSSSSNLQSSNKQMIVSKQYWDGSKWILAFFINGQKVDSYNINPITFPKEKFQAIVGPRIAIGSKIHGNISGIVEKCALFNRALSDEEIKNMYDCGINKSTPIIQKMQTSTLTMTPDDVDCETNLTNVTNEYNTLHKDNLKLQNEYDTEIILKEEDNNFMENSLKMFRKKIYDDNNQMNANFESFTNQSKIDDLIQYNKELSEKQKVQKDKINLIKEKELSLEKTNELLKTSSDRNNFKKKVIYTLIALIFFLFILSLSTYIYFVRDFKVNK